MAAVYDQWCIAALGAASVGKSALAIQFTLDCFDQQGLGEGFRKSFTLDDRMCYLEVLDTAGDEEYANLRDQWVREGQAFILVYSIASRSSFDRLGVLHQAVRRVKGDDAILLLVGNKCDMVDGREVSKEDGEALARQFGCAFIETSAKTAQNVDQAFKGVVRTLRQTKPPEPSPAPTPGRPRDKKKNRQCIIL
ncbi:ras protein [Mycena alexandri]|uniref:Ras protein n=1 Tax=Mycena alexandri TaxID=1745969 RepID=A0AAD6SRA3_9AGAR|nr:ras protein [Mycena alexandri]